MIATIDGILGNSPQPPIIIVQADHGVRFKVDSTQSHQDHMQASYAILNALHLPGFDLTQLDDYITPVNTFRFILDHYFDTDLEILQNKSYSSGPPHLYDFREVTQPQD